MKYTDVEIRDDWIEVDKYYLNTIVTKYNINTSDVVVLINNRKLDINNIDSHIETVLSIAGDEHLKKIMCQKF